MKNRLNWILSRLPADRGMLLASMSISLIFWVFVKLSKTYPAQQDFPLRYELVDDRSFLDTPPEVLRVDLEGKGWDLLYFYLFHKIEPFQFDAGAFPSGMIERWYLLERVGALLAPYGLKPLQIDQDYIRVSSEKMVNVLLPVRLEKTLEYAPGFHAREPYEIIPDSVQVQGPESLVKTLEFWPTDTGRIGPLRENVRVPLPMEGYHLKALQVAPETAELSLEVEPVVEKVFQFVPVQVKNAPGSFRIFPPSVQVTCVVGMKDYDQIDASDFLIEADLASARPGSSENTVALRVGPLPASVESIWISPQSVAYFLEKEQ